uniref:ADP ribosylation factor like GTPase 1 n=1 Tax=Pseudonaja textilis TaxID=8673 RepID=A0A670ZA33_PSETE
MGLLFSRIYDSVYGVEARILLLGLDAAGKTTLLYKLKSNEETSTIPTMVCGGKLSLILCSFGLEHFTALSSCSFGRCWLV